MVVLGRGAVSYERGIPVRQVRQGGGGRAPCGAIPNGCISGRLKFTARRRQFKKDYFFLSWPTSPYS